MLPLFLIINLMILSCSNDEVNKNTSIHVPVPEPQYNPEENDKIDSVVQMLKNESTSLDEEKINDNLDKMKEKSPELITVIENNRNKIISRYYEAIPDDGKSYRKRIQNLVKQLLSIDFSEDDIISIDWLMAPLFLNTYLTPKAKRQQLSELKKIFDKYINSFNENDREFYKQHWFEIIDCVAKSYNVIYTNIPDLTTYCDYFLKQDNDGLQYFDMDISEAVDSKKKQVKENYPYLSDKIINFLVECGFQYDGKPVEDKIVDDITSRFYDKYMTQCNLNNNSKEVIISTIKQWRMLFLKYITNDCKRFFKISTEGDNNPGDKLKILSINHCNTLTQETISESFKKNIISLVIYNLNQHRYYYVSEDKLSSFCSHIKWNALEGLFIYN